MITKVTDFITAVLEESVSPARSLVYRGHGDSEFKLVPSIFRTAERRANEHIILRELIASHPDDFANDSSALEMLVRMQHFSLPTRLLDVTFNPLVALYFACERVTRLAAPKGVSNVRKRHQADGEVVLISVRKRQIRYFDSDTVSCLANLARLRDNLKNKLDTSLPLLEFNDSLPVKRLTHFINQEKLGFEREIRPADLNRILLVKPKQSNRRILAQAGAFFLFGLSKEMDEDSDVEITRLRIPARHKADILRELDVLGVNQKTMFPDIERAALYITGSIVLPI